MHFTIKNKIIPENLRIKDNFDIGNRSNLNLQYSLDHFIAQQQIPRVTQCQVCCCQVSSTSLVFICQCKHLLCLTCAYKYIQSCMAQSKQIVCFQQLCQANIEIIQNPINTQNIKTQEKSFIQLIEISKKEQIINYCFNYRKLKNSKIGQCRNCENSLQGKCSVCKAKQIELPTNMKSCPNCKNILQKMQGCDHVKCICGYQFCYGCLTIWTRSHLCQFRIPKRQGFLYYIFAMIKAFLFLLLVCFLTPITLILGFFICLISSFLLGPYLYIKYLQVLSKTTQISNNLKGIVFIISILMFPLLALLCIIPGFCVPLVNICYKKKILFDPNILADLCNHLFECLNIIRLI